MKHLIFAAALAALGSMAQAEGGAPAIAQGISAQLAAQGYKSIEISRTWLGRVRILADLDGVSREIVLNPTTGEILRDYQPPGQMADRGSRGDFGAATSTSRTGGGIVDRATTTQTEAATAGQ